MPVWSQFVDLIQYGLRFFADYLGSAGISVIVFTIIFKTILLPLTVKAVRSTYAMQEVQPKIKELQKKYGKDRQKLSAETMKLYQEHGVNPAAGCLPMILQMPIFFGLYFAIENLSRAGGGVWSQSFLWMPNLSQPDPIHVLPILAGLFQFIQTKMTRPAGQGKAVDSQQQMMNSMMTFMPLMVVAFGWRFSSGPVIYWTVSAVYSAIQQWFITGWGSMRDWFPFLPDLPEHRRLGYQSPEQRAAAREKAGTGLFGRINQQIQRQIENVEQNPAEPNGTEPAAAATTTTRKQPTQRPAQRAKSSAPPPVPPRPDLVPRKSRPTKRGGSVDGD
ncbi:MAG TPA: YidC/Oxa1 family membrane protein insertase [Thermomicrobiaceae bacterium]|nr:YidC/Oxa1 family membrane protein insertase [Thermomicrobiaceae bacterium]